ncbi:MAG: hypothetical protein H7Y36_05545 [Armatimonadetes bacterium]|nr:hypothetical protein [Akkermansiaceae bacterium]
MKPIAAALSLILTLACSAGEIILHQPALGRLLRRPTRLQGGRHLLCRRHRQGTGRKTVPHPALAEFHRQGGVGGAMDAIEGMKEYWAPEIVERTGNSTSRAAWFRSAQLGFDLRGSGSLLRILVSACAALAPLCTPWFRPARPAGFRSAGGARLGAAVAGFRKPEIVIRHPVAP